MLVLLRCAAIAMIVQGALAILSAAGNLLSFGWMSGIAGNTFPGMTGPAPPQPDKLMTGLALFYIAVAGVRVASGTVQLLAGIRMLRFRNRALGFVAAGTCLLSLCECPCIPFALCAGVLTLVALLQRRIVLAFEAAARGVDPAEIVRQLEGPPAGWAQEQRAVPGDPDATAAPPRDVPPPGKD